MMEQLIERQLIASYPPTIEDRKDLKNKNVN